jgi:hypothetical protein
MGSQSKDVRIEQRRTLTKQLDLRMQKLADQGISSEEAHRDPLVKSLKSKIRETNTRIAAFDKHVLRTQELAQTKTEKLSEKATKKDKKPEPVVEEAPKKKARKNKEESKQAPQ